MKPEQDIKDMLEAEESALKDYVNTNDYVGKLQTQARIQILKFILTS